MRPSRSSRALEAIMRDLVATRDGATSFAERVWGVSLRHDLGRGHALVGRSVPDFAWSDGTRVGSLRRDGPGLLLDFDRCPARRTLAACRSARIGYVAGDVENRLGLHALLARPDGIVARASDTACDDTDLTQSLAQWFGE